MLKETTKKISKKLTATAFVILLCVLSVCVSPEAIKTEIQGIRNDMGNLEKIVDQKADNTVVAEHIDQVNNKIEQTTQLAEELSLWRKSVQAETINYGGAGWVVVGTGVIVLIFVGAGLLLVRAFMKRGNMLSLITRAVKSAGEESTSTVTHIKKHLKQCVQDGHSCEQDRHNLGNFAKKVGNFTKQK